MPDTVSLLRLLFREHATPERAEALLVEALWRAVAVMPPGSFEAAVGAALEQDGYMVSHTGGRGDDGIDLLAVRGTERLAVQCKRYDSAPVTPVQVREFLGAVVAAKATKGVFITTSTYTTAARQFAEAQSLELVDGSNLTAWLSGRHAWGPRCSQCGAAAPHLSDFAVGWICRSCRAFNSFER